LGFGGWGWWLGYGVLGVGKWVLSFVVGGWGFGIGFGDGMGA
jgi:hypothetical protein